MKVLNARLLSVLLLLPTVLRADAPPKADLALHVGSFHVVQVTQESAEAEIDLSVQTNVDAHVEHVEITGLHVNGLPFFARPLDAAVDVHRGEEIALPPISVTVYYRDLDSLEPLIRILEDERARVQAEIELTVHAKVLEQLVLGSSHPVAALTVNQMVEVQPPGGLFGRTSAIGLLKVGQLALGSGALGSGDHQGDPSWAPQLDAASTALLHARSCFAVPANAGAGQVCVDQLAFRLEPQSAISTAELLAPWRFDPALADPARGASRRTFASPSKP